MSERCYISLDKAKFNNLYSFLKKLSGSKDDVVRKTASGLLDKITHFYTAEAARDGEGECICLGFFTDELTRLLSLFTGAVRYTEDETDYFQPLFDAKMEQLADVDYPRRQKLKHFSPALIFLKNEREVLNAKARSILSELRENVSPLRCSFADFPSRYWIVEKRQKTYCTRYEIREIPEGWFVRKTFFSKAEKAKRVTEYKLNNETFAVEKREYAREPYDSDKGFDDDN